MNLPSKDHPLWAVAALAVVAALSWLLAGCHAHFHLGEKHYYGPASNPVPTQSAPVSEPSSPKTDTDLLMEELYELSS